MQKKILISITTITAVALVLAYVVAIAVFYQHSRRVFDAMLHDEAALLAVTLNDEDTSSRIESLESYASDTNVPRLTLIDPHGDVLYDSQFSQQTMEGHHNRPEIVKAFDKGEGTAVRDSSTAGEQLMYVAKKLPRDGSVIRVSRPIQTIRFSMLQGLPALAGAGLVLFAMAYAVARRQARALVKPLEEVDLDNPLNGAFYPEFKPLLERIASQNQTKEEIAQSRREFSANVSHELKTPLTSISGYAELIQEGLAKEEDVPEFARRIHQESTRLLALIRDIIDLSHLDETEENAVERQLKDIDLAKVARDVCTRLLQTASDAEISLDYSGEKAIIEGQEHLIDELASNLIDNAIKYNKPGGRVRVWVGAIQGKPMLEVSDTGIGIEEKDHDRVFERFYRVDKSHSRATGGTGLGLSIVKHVAAVHGAQIHMESALGRGTRITVTFPELDDDYDA